MKNFEERADQLSLKDIDECLADGEIFKSARLKLLAPGAKLLIGPRGTGKTHLMRYTYAHAMHSKSSPLVLYASFNRYLHLEPLLKKSPDALKRFHTWVVARLLLSVYDYLNDAELSSDQFSASGFTYGEGELRQLVALLERGSGDELYETVGRNLTVEHVHGAVHCLMGSLKRSRCVILLDDAALSLSDQYLVSFFEIFRLLKSEGVAPKASVYPGSTQYGPTFHASHEAEEVHLWLSIEDPDYSSIMGDIATRRLSLEESNAMNPDILELFKYVAFGIPRVFLRLLREYFDSKPGTSQQKVNKIVERQAALIGAEYDSLGLKLQQFSSIVTIGRKFFDRVISDVTVAQGEDSTKRNITIGLRQGDDRTPLADRMIRFLVEVGLLYPLQAVSHGANRKYDRFIPHIAFLYQQGAFREGRKATLKALPELMRQPSVKHPIRRELTTLLSADEISGLKLDLPPCQNCGAQRYNDSQLFCHQCGEQLVASSLFEECMKLPLENVPGISSALIARIHRDTKIKTIGHVVASQNASSDLQRANYVGPVRAESIINKVALTVEEFLS
ncbi:zinc ribbon domain-containing protein [Pseudomonas sp.]|uniref:zinc ribbon domain-containing protein n=1 Tax=Pseudomonas sp. TaxID=306 RepID=UPI0031D48588